MEYVSWSDKYSLAIPEVDAQHKQLFATINDLWTCVVTSAPKEKIVELLDRLDDYARTHFAAEEALMLAQHYPKLDDHIRQHHEFIAKIDWARGKLLNDPTTALQLLMFLRDWLAGHINIMDRHYAQHIEENKSATRGMVSGFFKMLRGEE